MSRLDSEISKPRSKFLKVKCKDCNMEQIIFEYASTHVTCIYCGSTIAIPRGGKALIKADIMEEYV